MSQLVHIIIIDRHYNDLYSPETKPQLWEKGDEDEGFHDDWLSIYSHNTQRTSNGSTMSSMSIGM